ncbi:hypothetical protein [Streptomyces sp. NPDC002790]|uniref:hypothetical protein n=1 Tax=Streptomyces sp. NPDC002790 TaxID=3154431 RepID=UPI0033196F09
MTADEQPPSPVRELIRTAEGVLTDAADGTTVSFPELRARLQAGERLRVRHETTDTDCTLDTIFDLLAACLPREALPKGLLR